MNRRIIVIASFIAIAVAAPVEGQQAPATRMRGFTITGMIGGAANTDLQRVPATTSGPGIAPLRRITADTSPVVAGAIGFWPSPYWGVRVHGSLAPTRLEVRDVADTDEGIRDGEFAESDARFWTADVAIMIRAPVTPGGRIVPYFLVGGGVISFDADQPGPATLAAGHDLRTSSTRAAGVFGLGAHVPVQRGNVALTFELTDHIFSTPIHDPVIDVTSGDEVEVANHFRLLTGVTLRIH